MRETDTLTAQSAGAGRPGMPRARGLERERRAPVEEDPYGPPTSSAARRGSSPARSIRTDRGAPDPGGDRVLEGLPLLRVVEHPSPCGAGGGTTSLRPKRSLVEAPREQPLRELAAHAGPLAKSRQELSVGSPVLLPRDVGEARRRSTEAWAIISVARTVLRQDTVDTLGPVRRGPLDRAASLLREDHRPASSRIVSRSARVDRAVADPRVVGVALEVVDPVRVHRAVEDRPFEGGRGGAAWGVTRSATSLGRRSNRSRMRGTSAAEGGQDGSVPSIRARETPSWLIPRTSAIGASSVLRERAVPEVMQEASRRHAPPARPSSPSRSAIWPTGSGPRAGLGGA